MDITQRFILFILLFFSTQLAWANLPYVPIQLPHDDVSHHENAPYPVTNMMEWWYFNGKITTKTGRHLGYYLSYNYIQRDFGTIKKLIPFIQIQIADIDNQKVYGNSVYFLNDNEWKLSTSQLDVSLGKNLWLHKKGSAYVTEGSLVLKDGTTLHFSLQFESTRGPLLASKTGLVDMWDNTNSYYYSLTHLITSGYFQLGNELLEIDPQQSLSWMDHQWGDFLITSFTHWMWASIQLDNGIELDFAVFPDKKTQEKIPKWANIIMPNDDRIYLTEPNQFEIHAHPVIPGQKHPTSYDLKIPAIDLNLNEIVADTPGQDINVPESMSTVSGTFRGMKVHGQANMENLFSY